VAGLKVQTSLFLLIFNIVAEECVFFNARLEGWTGRKSF
jgi:hypothetical protein